MAAVSVVFETAVHEDKILFEALHGFRACAKIAAKYRLSDVLDNLVVSSLSMFFYLPFTLSPSSSSVLIFF